MTDQMLSVDRALEVVLGRAERLPAEPVALEAAVGRYLAQDVRAGLDLPPFTNSAMDGYAVRVADTPGTLRVVGESAAGRPFDGVLGPGEAVMISTGAVVPEGADAVVMIERVQQVTTATSGQTITIADPARLRDCFREAGSDVRSGTLVIPAATLIRPAQIGAAAALGLTALACARRPRVAVMPTGDELRAAGEPLGPGQIYNSNGPMLRALIEDAGAQAVEVAAVADTVEAHRPALATALEHDAVITSGGVSVGPHDLVRTIGTELGIEELFWRIRLRPGKPLSFGVRTRAGKPPALVFGLPGNPVSTLVCFELFVRPALLAMQGADDPRPRFRAGVLARPIARNPERDELVRVWLDGEGALDPLPEQQSHQITISAQADGLVRIPSGAGEAAAGSTASYLPLREH